MNISRKALCLAYGLVAALALIGTWGNNIAYLQHLGYLAANQAFWIDTLANSASRSITVDIFFLAMAIFIWMVLEARRLGMRGVWWYLVFGMLLALSVTVPIFLINRERALAARDSSSPGGTMSTADVIGLWAVGLASAGYAVITLTRA